MPKYAMTIRRIARHAMAQRATVMRSITINIVYRLQERRYLPVAGIEPMPVYEMLLDRLKALVFVIHE